MRMQESELEKMQKEIDSFQQQNGVLQQKIEELKSANEIFQQQNHELKLETKTLTSIIEELTDKLCEKPKPSTHMEQFNELQTPENVSYISVFFKLYFDNIIQNHNFTVVQ